MITPMPPCPRPRLAPRALQLVLLATLAACGGGGDDAPPQAPVQGPPPPPPSPPAPPPPPAPQALHTSLNAAGTNGNIIEARTSQAPTAAGAAPSTVFDDFRVTSAASIASVAWQGIYCVQANGSPAPAATASQFVIAIHADLAGRPNLAAAPLVQTTVTAAAAGQTFERNVANLSCGSASNTTWALYDYQASLPAPVAVAANTTYWVSVQAITPSYDVYWGWRAGTADNNLSLMLFQGAYDVLTFDRAYSLLP
jgi:hypothetical protein